jgi:hypothetical protein
MMMTTITGSALIKRRPPIEQPKQQTPALLKSPPLSEVAQELITKVEKGSTEPAKATNAPRFIYLRPHDVKRMSLEEKIQEYGPVRAKGGFTVAYVVDDIPLENRKLVTYAVAQCSDQDAFNKVIGRNKAAGRLLAKCDKHAIHKAEFSVLPDTSWREIYNQIKNKVIAKYNLDFNVF